VGAGFFRAGDPFLLPGFLADFFAAFVFFFFGFICGRFCVVCVVCVICGEGA
jgi:hypothetical protein